MIRCICDGCKYNDEDCDKEDNEYMCNWCIEDNRVG